MKPRFIVLVLCCIVAGGCQRESGVPRSDPTKENSAPPDAQVVQLSADAIKSFGIEEGTVGERPNTTIIKTTGEIKADDNRVFHINALTGGRVVSDKVQLGDVIQSGQTLAVLQNQEVVKIYGDFRHQFHQNEIEIALSKTRARLATKNYERISSLYKEKIASEREFIKAEADKELEEETLKGLQKHSRHIVEEARALLRAYGVNIQDTSAERIESVCPVTAPAGGVIIEKNITVGDIVSSAQPLYVVGDLSQVWMDVNVYDKQLQDMKLGSKVRFTTDSLPGRVIQGTITFIKAFTDSSATFTARANIVNPGLALKPGMRGQVEIIESSGSARPFVPDGALQKYQDECFVFVVDSGRCYRKQDVKIEHQVSGGYLVSGVVPGQKIVTDGSFTLKAELMKRLSGGAPHD